MSSAKYHSERLGIRKTSRVLQFAAHTWDVSIAEVFTTLMKGGCVCVPSERIDDLPGFMRRHEVNWACLTPTVADLLKPDSVPGLRTLSIGGEHAKQDTFASWCRAVTLLNSYGPAETSVYSHCTKVKDATQSTDDIGLAFGCRTWLVNPENHEELVPMGAVGEILFEGPGLAKEYLHDPLKTRANFIENITWRNSLNAALGDEPEYRARLYKSGDLAVSDILDTF